MERGNGHNGQQSKVLVADLKWFFAKSKVSISLAITECSSFLKDLEEAGIIWEEESLVLQGDPRSVHRCVYQCLCSIEQKSFPLPTFFEHLFQKANLKKYPDLKPIYKEYREGRYKNRAHVTADVDKDRIIFAQDKVKICLAISDLFPFIHGLEDLTILSEIESLKLQADGMPVSRAIYECLSLIEKKDMKLSIVFEYIFQECYLKLYPGLKEILQEPCEDQAELFTGWNYASEYRRDLFHITKTGICQTINERFPFLYGLYDVGLLSRMQLLKLQADQRPTSDVLYKAMSLIEQKNDIEALCSYVFCAFYLKLFPHLRVILQKLNEALMLDKCPPLAGPAANPKHHKHHKSVSKHKTEKTGMKQHRPTKYSKSLTQSVSSAPDRPLHKPFSVTGLLEKRPLKAGPAKSQMKIKIYRCDVGSCRTAFSDLSKFKIHRSKHTAGKAKIPT